MQTVKLKENSWHYRLANTYGFNYFKSQDICTYIRSMLVGLFFAFAIVALVTAVALPFAVTLMNAIVYFQTGVFHFDEMVMASIAFGIAAFIIAIIATIVTIKEKRAQKKYEEMRDRIMKGLPVVEEPVKTRSFFSAWYQKLHDKTCFRIELE